MSLSDAAIRGRLQHWPVARLATTSAGGRPHLVPIVFALVGDEIWSPVDGKRKSGSELARVRNVRQRPEVSLLLDEYLADWSELWWIRVDATARVVRAGTGEDAVIDVAVAALRAKYPAYRETPVVGEEPTLLALRPTTFRSWSARP